ncbi:MAG TPA: DUF2642 domain-containing protein [Firmicutes bacterium]|nr:DUF2642 domain-containing protein [Bacillota bacterium]
MSTIDPGVARFDEPVFVRHLEAMIGQTVQVATACGTLVGVVREVFPDHFLLETAEGGGARQAAYGVLGAAYCGRRSRVAGGGGVAWRSRRAKILRENVALMASPVQTGRVPTAVTVDM